MSNWDMEADALWSELLRQKELHGPNPIPTGKELQILVEEVGEVARAMQENPDRMYEELIQVAAVAIRWANMVRNGE